METRENKKDKIAGIGVGSGKKDSFYFCVLEYFSEEKRWFLKTCQQLREFTYPETEDSLLSWSKDFELEKIVVDFPLSLPPCYDCSLNCPGSARCPVPDVLESRKVISALLERDQSFHDESPKKYEEERVKYETEGVSDERILSRSFKRKLKKNFVPYWNRSLDVKIWEKYYDELLYFFNSSYDSFGNENLIQILRFKYLKRHFPDQIKLFESNYLICLLELLRSKVIEKRNLIDLRSIDTAVLGRMDILNQIEKKLAVFFYENDKETMIKNPRAFQSFILTIAGRGLLDHDGHVFLNIEKNFFIPQFI